MTHDPELDAKLRAKVDELDSRALAEYAHTLNLFPPGWADGANPPISLAWPADDFDSDGVLIWDTAKAPDEE
ncbi:hypothetical protein ACFPET_02485 [Salininema proteolyticum]|uniref:Uncharacterized protein n=1 Tax=Salininema proteolyticum TaxID=1607685 RepID=A0ABV8TTW3_9ACTN